MYLGDDFVVFGTLLIISIFILLFIYRKKLFKAKYGDMDFVLFEENIKQYLQKNHPAINFDYSIINSTKNEANPKAKSYSIISNLVSQYIDATIDDDISPRQILKKNLWDSYTFNSRPVGTKLPNDWTKRKLLVCQRDNNICQRCGMSTKPETTHLVLIKSINEGGQFYLENLIIVCKDCHKITTKKDLKYLDIEDNLNSFITL